MQNSEQIVGRRCINQEMGVVFVRLMSSWISRIASVEKRVPSVLDKIHDQVVDGVGNELTFFEFECDACSVHQREEFLCTFDLLLQPFAKYNYIVELNVGQLITSMVRLESFRCVAES